MIANITSTPYTQPVCFGCKQQKNMVNIVDNIFNRLSVTRNRSNLGLLLGKNGKTDYVVEEKLFGKKAKISLKTDEGFQEIEIARDTESPLQIIPLSENLSSDKARLLIAKNLSNIDYKA